MGILSKLFGSSLLDGVKGIISEFKLDPAKKAELEAHFTDLQAQAEQADKDLEARLNDIAGQNIRTDASSSDSFVRRARPFFLWIMGVAIGFNLLIFPLVNLATGRGLIPLSIPTDYLSLYKYALCGYTGARTIEKLFDKA